MLRFILGEAGSGKSSAIIERIKTHAESGRRIFVIVPEQFSFEYERKMYQKLGSSVSNSINVLSFTRLARLIFDTFGSRSGEYADDSTKAALMYLALKEIRKNKSFMFFGRQAESRSFINDALEIVADLRRASVTADSLASRINGMDEKLKEKASDISMIYSAYDSIMTERGFRDSLTDITEAAAIANMNDFFEESVCFIDEFDSFSPDEFEMIDTMTAECTEINIALCTPETEKKENSLFSTVNTTYARLRTTAEKYSVAQETEILSENFRFKNDAVKKLSGSIFRRRSAQVCSGGAVQITEAKDLYKEADFVCSYIRKLVDENECRYGEITIASRQPEDYDVILKTALERYGIPFFSDEEASVMHTSVVILITSLLEMAGAKKLQSDVLFRYAKTGLTPVSLPETAFLENFCYKWNVDGTMWEESFTNTGLSDTENKEVLANAEALRLRLADPVLALRKKMKGSTAAQMCRYIYEFLEEQSVMNNVTGLIAEHRNKGITDTASELERLWNCIMDAFSTVAEVLGDEMTDSSEFAELFTLIVRQNRFLAPPQKLDIVSVVSAEKARVEGQKVIFVMGANEGILPFAAKSSGLLSSTDKEALEKMGIDLGKDTKRLLADERFVVYRLFSSASERVIISYPLCDAQGGTRFPSYILGQIAGMYSDSIKKSASGYDVLFYSPTPAAAYRNYVQGMFENEQEKASLREALYNIPEYRSRIEYLDFIGKDGIHAVSDTSLMGRLMGDRIQVSATSFEDYSECHFRYFCKYGLHIRARDRREMDFRDLGSLVHSCLENILSGCSTKDEFISLTDDDITEKIKEFAEKYKAENLAGDFGKNARLDSKFEKFTEDTLYLVNHLKEELAASQFMPEKFEFEINEATGGEPFRITGHEGTEIILKGKIDRVDSYTDPDTGEKFIRIIDYKTGVKNFELEKIIYGIDTQMLLYLFSVTAEGGYYSDTVPAGVLYMPSGSIEIGRDRTGDDDTDAYLNKFYRMSGVVLKELKVLRAMEENIAGIYIPAKLTADAVKKGTFELDKVRSRCLTRPQFERLRKHVKELLEKMAADLLDGDVSALPLKYDPQKDVCTYCDYKEICGNYPRKYERLVPDDVKEIEMNILGDDTTDGEEKRDGLD